MIINTEYLNIDKIIIHRVFKKQDKEEFGVAEYTEDIFTLGEIELSTIKSRIATAFSKGKRFFKLELEKVDRNSFYAYSKKFKNCTSNEFIEVSKSIADLLAMSHNKRTIPSGLLLIMEGNIRNKHFTLVIKAELQEAFTIKEIDDKKLLELVNDLFYLPLTIFIKWVS